MRHRGFEPRTTWLKVKCSTDWANIPYNYEVVVPKAGIEPATRGFSVLCSTNWAIWAKLRGQDLNLRPSGYEPDELPDCSIPRYEVTSDNICYQKNGQRWIRTTEAICSRFTVCPLWPLGNLPIYTQYEIMWKADDRTRTDNLLITNQLLCQLSHIGINIQKQICFLSLMFISQQTSATILSNSANI